MRDAAAIKLEQITGDLYSDCFERLNRDDAHWFAHSKLLAQQLGITEEDIVQKSCLDGGCGNGTLTYRLLELGAREVTAVDLHPTPKSDVFERYQGKVKFVTASLLDLPFKAESFDVVASTGVLQHTADPERALSELVRVLKKGSTLYLGVYGKHGLFSWTLGLVRIFTVRLPVIRRSFVERLIGFIGLGPLVRYQILDYLFVPNIYRSSPRMLRRWMQKYGMKDIRRVYAMTPKEAADFRHEGTVYTYDPRTFWNRILFGYGFINMQAVKE